MALSLSAAQVGLSLVAGGLTTLSPCVLPILPLVAGGAVQANAWSPIAMGLGMATSFATVGMILGVAGPALGIDAEWVRTGGAWLLVALATVMIVPGLGARFASWVAPIASSAGAVTARLDGRSAAGAFVLGAVLGLVWSPCSGPLLASAMTIVATQGGALRGAVILGAFGVGAAMPLIAAAYASRRGFSAVRDRILPHVEQARIAFGVLVGVVGVAILTSADKWLEAHLVRVMPDAWIAITTRF